MMKIRQILFAFIVACLCYFVVTIKPAFAEQIDSFHSRITINSDGTVAVTETIEYDFGYAPRHGIFRYVPFVKKSEQGTRYAMDIQIRSISDSFGNPYSFSVTKSGEEVSVKVGDKDRTITGKHTYVVEYRVKGALTYFKDHDELYWNITGNGWDVYDQNASATIELPADVPQDAIRVACYNGAYGSTLENCTATSSEPHSVTVRMNQSLAPHEGLTVVIGFPKNHVAILEPVKYVPFSETALGKLLIFLAVTALVILAVWWYLVYPIWIPIKWFLYGRDPTVGGSVTAWYDPPKDKQGRELTPGEAGTLIDERVDMNDICGTIIDAARRGYIKIVEKKKNDFTFIRIKETDSDKSLQPFEQELLGGIFGGKSEVRIKDKKLYETVEATKKKLYQSLTDLGFFPSNPNRQRLYYWGVFGLAFSTGNIPLVLVALLFGLSMPRKTIFGKQQAHVAESLRRFLVSQERQLSFQAKEQYWFEKLLPYAVAFGVEKIWAQRFEKIDITPPVWYEGYASGHFNTLVLIHSMNNSFNSIRTSAAPPSSTGHSSGFSGGFSGGGGGGGGGGSW